jgi:hypothetical protein
MRMGIDGLSLRVQQALGKSPCDGSAYLTFRRSQSQYKRNYFDKYFQDQSLRGASKSISFSVSFSQASMSFFTFR